ncbi:MAG: response regulator [Thermoanaerobaculia bacterium]
MTRILLADDHALFRQGLERVLAEGFPGAIFGHAGEIAQAMQRVREESWDVVILDISFAGRSGLDLLKEIKQTRPKLPVLVLSMHPEKQFAVRALKAGAAGYVTKKVVSEELLSAVRRVLGGGRWVTQEVADRLAAEIGIPADKLPHDLLSDREFQVFRLLAGGVTVKAIAEELAISVQTVSTYRARILEKMRLETNADLTQYALHHRLIG